MANLFQDVTSGLAELKQYYQGPIVNLLNNQMPVYRACEKVKQGWSGQQVVRPLRSRRNQGIGAVSDGGNLPTIGRQTTVQAIILARYLYLRFGITGPMIKASQSDIGSFVRSAAYELEQGYNDLKSDLNRQLSWTGRGDIATVSAAAVASTSLVLAGRESSEPALKFVDVGLQFDLYNSTGVTLKASGVTVVSINTGTAATATATVGLDQPVTAVTGDILVRSGSLNLEVQGLLAALDGGTSTIYNINRATTLSYQGNVTNLAAAALSLDGMQNPFNEGLRRGSVGKYNAIFTDFTTLRFYQKLLTPFQRYSNTLEGDGSFGSKGEFYMNFNGIPVVPDKDCPTRLFFLPQEVFKMYVLAEMEFADETGSMYIAQVDTDSFEVRIRHFVNMFNEQPSACSVLTNYIAP